MSNHPFSGVNSPFNFGDTAWSGVNLKISFTSKILRFWPQNSEVLASYVAKKFRGNLIPHEMAGRW